MAKRRKHARFEVLAAALLAGLAGLALFIVGCGGRAAADPATPETKSQRETHPERAAAQESSPTAAAAQASPGGDLDRPPFETRLKAPSLDGGTAWINTSRPIRLEDLRGKFVLLDFWTYCCINCLHILPELKKLEEKYPNQIVVIGVHSAKFDGEKQTRNILDAVKRHDVAHPVVNDAHHEIWDRYEINAWPTMLIIDPEGYLVAANSGEIDFEALDQFFQSVIPYYRRHKLLDEKPFRLAEIAANEAAGPLRYPGKVLADEVSDRLFIADSGHHRIVVARLDGTPLDVIGSGRLGNRDGDYSVAEFRRPQGMVVHGDQLYVADTENHLVRKVDLKRKQVTTIAGTGRQGRGFWPGMEQIRLDPETRNPLFPKVWQSPPRQARLASPWALAIHGDWLYIAMAGAHQIWRMSLDEKTLEVFAGDGLEDIRDGKRVPESPPRVGRFGYEPGYASFAQPSGLAIDGNQLYVADSEGSAIRAVPLMGDEPVRTVAGPMHMPRGRALFTFGDRDGAGEEVRLQHPLGITARDGRLYIADTYNHKIKHIDARSGKTETLFGTGPARDDRSSPFAEPGGLSSTARRLYVADTNNHAVRTIELVGQPRVRTLPLPGLAPPKAQTSEESEEDVFDGAPQVRLPATTIRPTNGKLALSLELTLPEGWKTNPLGPMRYQIHVDGDAGPIDVGALARDVEVAAAARSTTLEIPIPLREKTGKCRLRVSLVYYYCREGAEGVCKSGAVTWTAPVELAAAAESDRLRLRHQVQD